MGADLLAVSARTAFVHGWASTLGPLTPRVHAACRFAIGLVREHGDAPEVLESVMRLGALEGVLAAVHDRRERLYAAHRKAVTDAYRALLSRVSVDSLVRAFRSRLGLTEAAAGSPARHAADIAAAGTLHTVIYPATPDYRATVTAIGDAVRDAQAEGSAGAGALVADRAGYIGFDFDLAFADAHTALRNLDTYRAQSPRWLAKVLDGHAADIGRALADAAENGDDFDGMRAAVHGALDGADIRAVDSVIDLAMGQSFTRGALSVYAREGVEMVDYMAAGGPRVCPRCLDAESGSPWPRDSVPQPPLHPACRCVISVSTDSVLSLSANLAQYLVS